MTDQPDGAGKKLQTPPFLGSEKASTEAETALSIEKQKLNQNNSIPEIADLGKGDFNYDITSNFDKKNDKEDYGEPIDNNENEIQRDLQRQREEQIQQLSAELNRKEKGGSSNIMMTGAISKIRHLPGIGVLLSQIQTSKGLENKIHTIEAIIFKLKLAKLGAAVIDAVKTWGLIAVPLIIPSFGLILIIAIPILFIMLLLATILQEHGPFPSAKAIGNAIKPLNTALIELRKKLQEERTKQALLKNLNQLQSDT